MKDLTKNYDYAKLIAEEKHHFAEAEITDQLTEGGVHAHDSWDHYWARIAHRIEASGFADVPGLLERSQPELDRPQRVLSLGSGYCGHEIMLADQFRRPVEITCTDINGELFDQAKTAAGDRGLPLSFREVDLNFIEIEKDHYDLIFAHASLHHVINLEHLFGQIREGLTPGGLFHLVEVIGQNRRLLWRANEAFVNRALKLLPRSIRGNCRVKARIEQDGMEGIRQEEMVPIIHQNFEPMFELGHGAFMRYLCTHRRLGQRLDPRDPERRRYLDMLIDLDESCIRTGVLEPVELWGLYRPRSS